MKNYTYPLIALLVIYIALDGNAQRRRFIRPKRLQNRPKISSKASIQDGSVKDCGGNISVTSESGTLTSPGYPNQYKSDLNCVWQLSSPKGKKIVLNIVDLNLEYSSNCSYDHLNIYDTSTAEDNLLHNICGVKKDTVLNLNTNEVLVSFTTDDTYEEKGFRIIYSLDTVASTSLETCTRQLLTGTEGNLSSPNYPHSYPSNSDCWYHITVPENYIIYLSFQALKLEFDEKCVYDYLAVYDGPDENSQKLGQYCSNRSSIPIKSTKNTLTLHFVSDDLLNETGFLARYSTFGFIGESGSIGACLFKRGEKNGTVTSPNYPEKYPSNTRCKIEIEAPEGYLVSFSFDDIHLEQDTNCSFDWVSIKDVSGSHEGKTLSTFCGDYKTPPKVATVSSKILIDFHTDEFTEFRGFKAHYVFVPDVKRIQQSSQYNNQITQDIFVQVSPNATVQEGKRHAISCIPKSSTSRIRWFKGDRFLGGTSMPAGIKLVSHTTLEISSMASEFVGPYTCVLSSPDSSSINATIWIKMEGGNIQCDITFLVKPQDTTVAEKVEFSLLECSTSTPNVTISWRKDDIPIVPNQRFEINGNSHLGLYRLLPEDEGLYSCVAENKLKRCSRGVSAIVTVKRQHNVSEICGLPKSGNSHIDKLGLDSGRIVGGMAAKKGSHPWQVMFYENRRRAFCGGVLLNERWVISACHCFHAHFTSNLDMSRVAIRLGKLDQSQFETEEHNTVILKVIEHPNFNEKSFDNDIALIRMKDSVTFTDYILPLCLGDWKFIEDKIFSKTDAIGVVTGWGKLTENGDSPTMLRELELPIKKKEVCVKSTTRTVTRNMFCAGYTQETASDSCQGDSGGPFAVQRSGRWYLVGLVSWGEGCARSDKYGFYTKVNNYHSWIKDIISTS